ncbi:MAG TPA: TspO/MBR family protein [Thermoanaerobaculia bacterium]
MKSGIVIAILVLAAALFGGMFTPGEWHASLDKPSWNPPNWVFGPVWTILYVMIAVAGWLAWRNRARSTLPVRLWGGQLLLNALWSWLFFGLKQPGFAFLEIVILWLLIAAFVVVSWRISRAASLLFVPYALWVGFASALNFAIWRLNP